MYYDFKFELAKKLEECLMNLLYSNQYVTIKTIRRMEKVDLLYDQQKISKDEHTKLCEKLKNNDHNKIKSLIKQLDAYISYKTNPILTERYYFFSEISKMRNRSDEMFIDIINKTALVVKILI